MAPKEATLRILWARAAGRCSVCRSPLVMAPIGGRAGGPSPAADREAPEREAEGAGGRSGRIARITAAAGERFDNLILLCEEHEKAKRRGLDAPSAESLAEIKAGHEEWVRNSPLADHPAGSTVRYDPRYQGVTLLPRVRSGDALVRLLEGIHSAQYDHDEPATRQERELLEGFLGYIRGLTDLWNDYAPAERARAAGHLGDQVRALYRGGYLLFATRYTAEADLAGTAGIWSILRLWIVREGADSEPAKG